MAKPIFIMFYGTKNVETSYVKENITAWANALGERIGMDYHTILVEMVEEIGFRFQMFSDKEIEPIELEKLKEIVNQK